MLPLLAATIISTTISNASTGGNVVQGGDVVNGSSYSSVSVQTYAGNDGGTSTVQIETDNNGQVNDQTITKTIPPGGSADIYVATSTGSGSSRVEAESTAGAGVSATSSKVRHLMSGLFGTSSASSSFSIATSKPALGLQLQVFLRGFFNFFHFW